MSDHEYHAKLSPSGASRWLNCPGSVVLEASYPNDDTAYSAEGTAAHQVATWCLKNPANPPASTFEGQTLAVGKFTIPITKDMARYVQSYVDYVREQAEGKMLFVEVAVPIGHLTGETGATGIADAIIVDTKAKHILVIDLKYGAGVPVYADNNEQMQMYGLGAIEECSMICDFDSATLVIYQPRVRDLPDEWDVSVEDLERFAETIAAGSDTIRAASARADAGSDAWVEAYLHPGEKQCKFCAVAKHACPAYKAEMLDVLGAPAASAGDFAAFVPEPVTEDTGDNWLAVMFSKTSLIEALCKSVRAEVERRCFAGGGTWGEHKLVEGRAGNSAYTDEEEAEKMLRSFRYTVDQIYTKKVISPTAAKKLLKPEPKRWEKLSTLIHRPSGKLSVVHISDPRPAASVVATVSDFAEFVNTAE